MAAVLRLGKTEPLQGIDWVVVEHAATGDYRASGLSAVEDVVFGPHRYNSEREAVGAAQAWALHNAVPVIYVREPA